MMFCRNKDSTASIFCYRNRCASESWENASGGRSLTEERLARNHDLLGLMISIEWGANRCAHVHVHPRRAISTNAISVYSTTEAKRAHDPCARKAPSFSLELFQAAFCFRLTAWIAWFSWPVLIPHATVPVSDAPVPCLFRSCVLSGRVNYQDREYPSRQKECESLLLTYCYEWSASYYGAQFARRVAAAKDMTLAFSSRSCLGAGVLSPRP